jgi:hypothetical protein
MRWLAALALVACSSTARPPEPTRPVVNPPLPVAAPVPDLAKPIPTVHAKRDAREAPHGGTILTLALSPDGTSVLSADELGGVRLWPALDGSQEPRIVDMPLAKQLAIARVTGGFSAVARDEAGGLYVAKLDDTGRQLSHTTLPAEPPVTGMAMSAQGLLAWRSDQTLLLLDGDGATKDKLGTEPQQRLVAVAVSGKRAIVVLEREGSKRDARWLQLEPKLAWGAWIKLDAVLEGPVEITLAPSGKRLAALIGPKDPQAVRKSALDGLGRWAVFDLAKGKEITGEATGTNNVEIGFVGDDQLAIGGLNGLSWIDLTQAKPKPSATTPVSPGARTQASLATGGGRAITSINGDLVLATPAKTEYLGYDTVAPRIAEVGPDGQLLVGVGDHLLLLDKDLRGAGKPFTGITGIVAELRWVGEDDWLFESSTPNAPTLQISLVDGKHGTTVVRSGIKEVQILSYEPSTQQVTMSFGAESEVAHFDRKRRKLDRMASVKKVSAYEQTMFVPVSPALARGTQLVQITMKDRSTVKWLRDSAALDKAATSVTVEGPFAGADAAGHVFMWRNTPAGQLELVLYADGKPVRTLPNTGAVALWPEPSGKRYVEVAPSTVALYDITGKQLWFQQLATSQEALWLTDGSIAIISAGGIARLDPATGAVTAARCGWRFGVADKPHPATPRVEPLCAQVRR